MTGCRTPSDPVLPRRRVFVGAVAGAVLAGVGAPASAALKRGAEVPMFTVDAVLAGKDFRFDLAEALQRGPVVLYFYPKAFTSGCTVEAHAFAEATPRFDALGATVVGLSSDDVATLRRFSLEACRSRFAVAADPDGRVIRQYDAKLGWLPGNTADRISYLITPDRKVFDLHVGMGPEEHVRNMLKAVERWSAQRSAGGTP